MHFFSKQTNPKVIGTISFDSTYNVNTAIKDFVEREFTNFEFKLFKMRSVALKLINTDTLFKSYKNMSLNLIPLISNNEKKVYVLTGPKDNGVVIFGNDYLIVFDDKDSVESKKQLHRNLIAINYGDKTENGDTIVGAMHTHLGETGDFITATDICTLMLYGKFAKWKQYTVVSEHYFSFWNCETNEFVAITREAMDKINNDQKKRKKKN